jgi:uncharacterized NAD(P)/FAD-binding protein YdhS
VPHAVSWDVVSIPIIIVGGGFTGAATAVQLVRASEAPLDVAVVEPAADLGRGAAYSSTDPDHRLNGSAGTHMVDPLEADALVRWCESTRLLERDPEALAPNGHLYVRRSDFGRFVGETVAANARRPNGSAIRHVRDRAIGVTRTEGGWNVALAGGMRLDARMLVAATGNGGMRLLWPFHPALASHPAVVADPFDAERIRTIARGARVLVIGAGLTALDILSTLVRRGHTQPLTVLSRHGLRPRPQRPPNPDSTAARLFERIDGPIPDFIADTKPTARAFIRALRRRIAQAQAAGGDWYGPFDDLRDSVWKVWPMLDTVEKKRFLRRARPWYDAHRFRTPPQNDALVGEAEANGGVVYRRGRLQEAAAEGRAVRVRWLENSNGETVEGVFEAVINCTGLDAACGASDNPFLSSLIAAGLLRRDPTGFGFQVDAQCRAIGSGARPVERLHVLGPPTAGTFGDPLGVLFIAPQIRRAMPGMIREVARAARASERT